MYKLPSGSRQTLIPVAAVLENKKSQGYKKRERAGSSPWRIAIDKFKKTLLILKQFGKICIQL